MEVSHQSSVISHQSSVISHQEQRLSVCIIVALYL
jgi:hypothetical protein